MTDREKAVYLKRFETKLSERNRKQLKKMFIDFRKIIEKDNSNFSVFDDIKIDFDIFKKLAKKTLTEIFIYNVKSTLNTYTKLFGWELSKTKLQGIRDIMINNYNKKYGADKVTQITETTRKILNDVIVKSQDKGLGLNGIVKEIVTRVDDMSITRAKTIARTETSSAINNTSLKTAKISKMKKKKWIHIGGRYTSRENHKSLNNKTIGIDELFDLGNGVKALCPHHQDLPAKEVINCNCLIIFK